jgi:glycosyltransferase involved in cell wall biosynthesis
MVNVINKIQNEHKRMVVFIIPSLYRAGAERVLHEVVSHLDKSVFECHVICLFCQPNPFKFSAEVRIYYLFRNQAFQVAKGYLNKLFKLVNATRIIYRLTKLLSMFPRDAILVPFIEYTTLHTVLAQFISRRQVIARPASTGLPFVQYTFKSKIRRLVEILFLKADWALADKIVVQSKGLRSDLVKNFSIPSQKIQIIPNPVNLDMIKHMKDRKINLDFAKLTGKTVFVHIGRLVDKKNHLLLLQASELLKKRGERFVVLCAGSGPLKHKIKQLISDYGLDENVIMLGNLANPFALMSKARALVLTSYHESFSLVLVEAMASGTAVIAVDCPYGPADVLDKGTYGLLVPMNNPESLADAMLKMANDDSLFEAYKRKGQQRALAYDVHTIVKKWEKLLNGCS